MGGLQTVSANPLLPVFREETRPWRRGGWRRCAGPPRNRRRCGKPRTAGWRRRGRRQLPRRRRRRRRHLRPVELHDPRGIPWRRFFPALSRPGQRRSCGRAAAIGVLRCCCCWPLGCGALRTLGGRFRTRPRRCLGVRAGSCGSCHLRLWLLFPRLVIRSGDRRRRRLPRQRLWAAGGPLLPLLYRASRADHACP